MKVLFPIQATSRLCTSVSVTFSQKRGFVAFVQELCPTQEYKLTNLVRSGWLVYLEVNRGESASIFTELIPQLFFTYSSSYAFLF